MTGKPLADRTALVAGVGPGIGAGIAVSLARAGARVACADIAPARAQACARELSGFGAESLAVAGDLSDEAEVARVIETASGSLGTVDILVNGVAVFDERSVLSMEYGCYLRQLRIILGTAFLLTKAVANDLITAGRPGSIIHLVSTAGHQGQADNIGYCSAKSGLLNFARSAAAELGQFKIRVNTMTPTATDPVEGQQRAVRWGMAGDTIGLSPRQAANRARLPLGELPSPQDYGEAVVFLSSDAARAITGSDLVVDAGALASYWATSPGDHRVRREEAAKR